jgi:hypothetical protein
VRYFPLLPIWCNPIAIPVISLSTVIGSTEPIKTVVPTGKPIIGKRAIRVSVSVEVLNGGLFGWKPPSLAGTRSNQRGAGEDQFPPMLRLAPFFFLASKA